MREESPDPREESLREVAETTRKRKNVDWMLQTEQMTIKGVKGERPTQKEGPYPRPGEKSITGGGKTSLHMAGEVGSLTEKMVNPSRGEKC